MGTLLRLCVYLIMWRKSRCLKKEPVDRFHNSKNTRSFYDVSRYPAAGKCFRKARYPAVRNFDQFSPNSSLNSSKNIRYLFRSLKRL